ncbi:CD99 antigen isoform X2 [Pseudonaja textilis]|uniref:CD99 antigen isoform X2 n=1 Tax=Pseudonaja textilis TaxID=8673 RepID=UPI000EA8D52C|nr:CD99 antigen isoform X2 [Pseudonaja textilis]
MGRLALSLLSLALLLLAALCRGQDLDLSDALGTFASTKRPSAVTKKPSDGFDLEDAIGGDDSKKTAAPPPQPKPGSNGHSGGFEDSDLFDGDLPPENPQSGHPSNPSSGGDSSGSAGDSPGMLAGIISSVVVAIAGAISSFIAYQKKKLCFKASDQENIPVESQQGAHAAPSVQRTLLQKQ